MADKLGIQVEVGFEEYSKVDAKAKQLLKQLQQNNKLGLIVDQNAFNNIEQQFNKLKSSFSQGLKIDSVNGLDAITQKFSSADGISQNLYQTISKFTNEAKQAVTVIESIDINTGKVLSSTTSVTNQIKKQATEQETINTKIRQYQDSMGNMVKNLQTKYKDLVPQTQLAEFQQSLSKLNATDMSKLRTQIKDLDNQFKSMVADTKASGSQLGQKDTQSWMSEMTTNLAKFGLWYGIAGAVTSGVSAMKNAVSTVVTMEDALTDLNKVVDLTGQQMENMKQSSFNLGTQLGRSSQDIVEAYAEFGRYNKNLSDIQNLAKTAVMASNVTDLTAENAAKDLNTTMIAFGINAKDSMNILNSWNELQNNFRVSAEDLADSIGKVGSIAKQTGTDLNSLNAMTTELVGATGITGSEAGTAIKGIMSRVYNMGDEGDGGKAQQKLKELGIDVVDLQGNLKPLDQILKQLNKSFEGLSQAQKVSIEQILGGTYHYAKAASLIENYGMVVDATNTSINSQNSALDENQKYLETTTAKFNQFKVQMQSLADSSVSTGLLKGVLETATSGAKGLEGMIKQFGLLGTLIPAISASMVAFNKNFQAVSVGSDGISMAKGGVFENMSKNISSVKLRYDELRTSFQSSGKEFPNILERANMGMQALKVSTIAQEVAQTALNAAIGLGIGLLVSLVATGISKLINASKEAQENVQKLTKEMGDINQAEKLVRQYSELQDQLKNTKEGSEEYKQTQQDVLNIQKQLAQQFPNLVDGYDSENNAIIRNMDNLKKYTEQQRQQILAKAGDVYDSNLKGITKQKGDSGGLGGLTTGGLGSRQSDIEKYNQLVAERTSALNDKNTKSAASYAEEIDKLSAKFKDFNEASVQLYNIGKTDVMYFDEASGKLVKYSDYISQNSSEISTNTKKTSDWIESTRQGFKSLEELQKSFDDVTDKIRFYNTVLAESQTKQGLSASSMKSILKEHQELLPYLGDEAQLRDVLSQKIKEEENNQMQAYSNMISADAQYYNAKVKNNQSAQNAMNGLLSQFVDAQGKAYNIDLRNYETIEQMKAAATTKIVQSLAGIWAKYYDVQAQEFDSTYMSGLMSMSMSSNPQVQAQAAQMEAVADKIKAAVSRMNNLANSVTMPNINFGAINTEGIGAIDKLNNEGAKSAEDAAKKAEELRKKMIDNVKDVESAITEIIKKEFEKRKQAIDDEYNKQKDALQKEKDLYDQQNETDDYNKNLKKEQETMNQLKASETSARRDTSLAGQARLRDILKQEQDQQDKIDQMVLEHTRSTNDKMFDDKISELDKEKDAKQKALEDQYSDENISKMVNKSMYTGVINGLGSVEDAYRNFQNTYNNGLTASGKIMEDELLSKWREVQSLINGTSGVNIGVSFGNLPKYKDGGIIQHTGMAWVDGTPNDPELAVNGKQAINLLRNMALGTTLTPKISNRNNAPNININTPLISVTGGVNSDVMSRLESFATKIKDDVTNGIMKELNNQAIYPR